MRLRLLAALLAAAIAVTGAASVIRPTPGLQERALVVEIPSHVGVTVIARHLEAEGAVRSAWMAMAVATLRGDARRLKAGEYEFPQGASTIAIVRMVESGRVRQHPVLHPEGATVRELATVLEAARLARADDVIRVANDPVFLAAQNIEGPSVEGYLFPDTYQLVRGLKVEEILGRMVQRTRTKLTPDILARARARGLGVHPLLTLASIIEREAAVPEERRLIAAVFWNRLQIA